MAKFASFSTFGRLITSYASGVTIRNKATTLPNRAAIFIYESGVDDSGSAERTLTLTTPRSYNYTWFNPGGMPSSVTNGRPGDTWYIRAIPGSVGFDGSSSTGGVWLPMTQGRVFGITNTTAETNLTTTFQLQFSKTAGTSVEGANYNVTLTADTTSAPVGGGGGGGDDGSVAILSYLPGTPKFAGEMKPGDPLVLLGDDMESSKPGKVVSNRFSLQKLVRMTTESGITLTCSDNTPMTLRDGSYCNSTDILGKDVPVQDENGFRWEEVMQLDSAGMGEVATIYCLDQCYAAGDHPGKYIFTHNANVVK